MKNKHILETKIKSIQHYQAEIERLQQAIETNRAVLKEIGASMIEFFPFAEGDVLVKGDRFILIEKVVKSEVSAYDKGGFHFTVEFIRNGKYGFEACNKVTESWNLTEANNYQFVKNIKE